MNVSQSSSLQTNPEIDLQRDPDIKTKASLHIDSIFCEYENMKEITLSKEKKAKYQNLIYIGILFYANRESMQERNGGLSVELYDISMFYSFVKLTNSQISECDYTQNKIRFMELHRTCMDIIVFNNFTQNFLRY